MSRVCRTGCHPKNLLIENSCCWLVLEVKALCMPDEAYSSDISSASGGNGTASSLPFAVEVDSGCVDRDTLSAIPGDGPIADEPEDATRPQPGVEPGVGPGVGEPTA